MFKLIDKDNWKRKPYFDHYFSQIRCTYSITVNIDISGIIAFKNKSRSKLYPLLIYVLTIMKSFELQSMTKGSWEYGIPYCRVILFFMRRMKPFPICGRSGMMIL